MLMWQVFSESHRRDPGRGAEALQHGTHVGRGRRDHEVGGIQTQIVLGVGHRGAQHLGDRAGGAVRHELEHDQRIAIGATADLIEHPAHLGHGATDVAAMGLSRLVGAVSHVLSGLLSCP